MRLLLLGGTRFLGRSIVEAALAHNHEVTLFNRGRSNPGLFPDLEHLQGDRDGDLHALKGHTWDAVIDTSGYIPRIVRQSAEALVNSVKRYVFISTISVYSDFARQEMDESGPLATLKDESVEEITGETYGALKVLCERVVEELYPDRALIVRPGLIVGPGDSTDRFTYWPYRVAQGGEMLAPGTPDDPLQFIDVRDLAAWVVRMVEEQKTGIYNATGPNSPLPLHTLLEESKTITDSDARFTWVDETFLEERQIEELPVWVPSAYLGFSTIDCRKARQDGLTFRPLSETIKDTLTWKKGTGEPLKAGLKPEQEQRLLQEWHTKQQ